MPAESALDAMNEALESETPEVIEETLPDETLEGEAPAAKTDTIETPEGEEGAGEEEDGEGKGELVRDPVTGKFVKKGEESDPTKGAKQEQKADAKTKDKEAKKTDPVNDPIPKDLKPATQERMRSLVKMTKDLTTERDEVKQNFEYLVGGLQATGTTPEQYGEVLSFMAMFNSRDPEQQVKALDLLEGVTDRLATMLGRDRNVSDPLTQHADLKDAVARGQITPQYAKEIARTRNQGAFRQEITTAVQTRESQQVQTQRELDGARTGLNQLEAQLKASDPQYGQKRAQLVPVLQPIFKSLPPSQWQQAFQQAYNALKLPTTIKPRAVPTQQPMRAGRSAGTGGNSTGGMATTPGSMYDAISGAIASASRR